MVASSGVRVGQYPARVGEVKWTKKISVYRKKYVKKGGGQQMCPLLAPCRMPIYMSLKSTHLSSQLSHLSRFKPIKFACLNFNLTHLEQIQLHFSPFYPKANLLHSEERPQLLLKPAHLLQRPGLLSFQVSKALPALFKTFSSSFEAH